MNKIKNDKKILNIGLLAHVDAGKTTITEQILYYSGAQRIIGNVDKGTSATDDLPVEKERGISVRCATATFEYKGAKVNIIDTPGHVDFCAEVEYSLRAMDVVILVVSAVEGVQGHTISLFAAIKQMKIPCVLFINKIDRVGADVDVVVNDIEKTLTKKIIVLQALQNDKIISLWNKNNLNDEIIQRLVEFDDDLMEVYLEGQTSDFELLDELLTKAVSQSQLIPVLYGSAKNAIGIGELLELLINNLKWPAGDDEKPLSAVVFKIEHDQSLGKMCYMRVFNGKIKPRDCIKNVSRAVSTDQKTGQLKINSKGKYQNIDKICAGDSGIVSGLSFAKVGDIYGEIGSIPQMFSLSTPILTIRVKPKANSQIMELVQALNQMCDEDPLLAMQWLADLRELHVKITGMIQVEILHSQLLQRYSLDTEFSEPSVIYKETPQSISYGYERYWMPKPCWAILKLKIEPAQQGSGVTYSSEVSVNDVAAKYQNEIEQTINKSLEQGTKGWQVTDCKITLVEGEDHNVHSRSGDFIVATPMAILNGLNESGTTLLEPILSFYISASLDLLGTITSDITKMRGTFDNPIIENDLFVLTGNYPASTSMKYPIRLASLSAGKAKLSTKLSSYQPCTDEQGQIRPYQGISPLDRDKWILQARKAL